MRALLPAFRNYYFISVKGSDRNRFFKKSIVWRVKWKGTGAYMVTVFQAFKESIEVHRIFSQVLSFVCVHTRAFYPF